MVKYREEIQEKLHNFKNYELEYVPRSQNKYADALATLVLKMGHTDEDLIQIPLETKSKPIHSSMQQSNGWIQSIKEKLENPEVKDIREIKAFILINNQVYKRFSNGVLAKCIDEEFGRKVLDEIHFKICCLDGPTLARRIQRLGYFWPE